MNEEYYYLLCMYEHHKRLGKEVYERFPSYVRNKIKAHSIHLCDFFYQSKDPTSKINKEFLGMYQLGTGIIHLIPKDYLSEDAVKGLIVHETAHAYINYKSFLWKKVHRLIHKLKLAKIKKEFPNIYYSSDDPVEELQADLLGHKWGFVKEIEKLREESTIWIDDKAHITNPN